MDCISFGEDFLRYDSKEQLSLPDAVSRVVLRVL